jgi:phosphoadenosine phosphosulfate reductase
MSLIENGIFGTIDKVEIAIQRLKDFEPPGGYWGATSFGKDSIVIMELGNMSGCKIEWHHSLTTIDPPDLILFGRNNFPRVHIDKPPIPLLKLLPIKGFPTSSNRWCCGEYKERGGSNRRVLTGIRWAESFRRSKREMVEACYRNKSKVYINPIIDWTDADVWEFIKSRNLPYCRLYDEGFTRIGCVMCPKASLYNRRREAERWPGIAKAWEKAFLRLYENKKDRVAFKRWENGYEMFGWWMSAQQAKEDPDQTVMFE